MNNDNLSQDFLQSVLLLSGYRYKIWNLFFVHTNCDLMMALSRCSSLLVQGCQCPASYRWLSSPTHLIQITYSLESGVLEQGNIKNMQGGESPGPGMINPDLGESLGIRGITFHLLWPMNDCNGLHSNPSVTCHGILINRHVNSKRQRSWKSVYLTHFRTIHLIIVKLFDSESHLLTSWWC